MLSAKCITYGRVEFLEESLHSFLTQDYDGEKELVIVNDYPLQKLVFNHPDVRIFNLDTTFSTIGEKENFATEQCRGDVIMQWDDDDVAMPWHLNNVKKYFTDDVNILHWNPGVFVNNNTITDITWIGNSGIVFRKSAWEVVGKHPLENAGYDMTFIQNLHSYGGVLFATPPKEEASWFYIWGGRGYHMSGQGHDVDGRPNVIQRHSEYVESLRQQGKIPVGEVTLSPNWKFDYVKMLKDYVNK